MRPAFAAAWVVAVVSAAALAASPDEVTTLTADFDAHADRTRVLALLSPT